VIDGLPVPDIRYANSSGLKIAYQVFGDGPMDLIMVPGFISHIEHAWREPMLSRFLRRLSGFTRVIAFDKRGMGLSDRDPKRITPSLTERCDDIAAVMDAAGSTIAGLLAWSEGGPTALQFCASRPERCGGLILMGTAARFSTAPDYPWGVPREVLRLFVDTMEAEWGTGVGFELYAPSLADDRRAKAWWASFQRLAATPGAVAASLAMHVDVDVRPLIPGVRVPTLVLHRRFDRVVPVECGQFLGQAMPTATYVEDPDGDHMFWLGSQSATLEVIRQFLAGTPQGAGIARLSRSQRRVRSGWESLTEAELTVVGLIGHGMTNPQMAERLFVSPRTVQTHVAHIMVKLGMDRRAEIAAEATRRDLR
jgi:pimeloyl-ACP methyl ester carboxylesterase/DNA-binding CsgD family transcriptional regulator